MLREENGRRYSLKKEVGKCSGMREVIEIHD